MDYRDTITWLSRYRQAVLSLRRKQAEYRQIIALQGSVRAVRQDITGHSTDINDLSDKIIKRESAAINVVKAAADARNALEETAQTIDLLPEEIHKQVLSMRYIQLTPDGAFPPFESIAEESGYSYRHTLRLHEAGVTALGEIIEQKEITKDASKTGKLAAQAEKTEERVL